MRWASISKKMQEYYNAPFRSAVAREQREHEDAFMLMVCADALGLPNPAAYYTLELLPLLYDDIHAWHQRMGMDQSAIEGFSCC